MLEPFLKKAFPVIAARSGLSRSIGVRYRGRGLIFMLHSVSDDATVHIDQGIHCPQSKLAFILQWLQRAGLEFVTLDEAVARLESPAAAPFAAFTFDDGYADTLTHALPVMQHFGAPLTVYVVTSMITGGLNAWWLGLAALFAARDRVECTELGWNFSCPDLAAKRRAFQKADSFVRSNPGTLAYVCELIADSGFDCAALAAREALTVDGLRTLARHPLVTIGAHGISHGHLSQVAPETARQEMTESRRFLQSLTDSEIAHFAYPYGHAAACAAREEGLARSAGFRTAVTTRRGTLSPRHLDHLHALPREPLSGQDTRHSLRCKIDGVYRAAYSRWGDPVAHM